METLSIIAQLFTGLGALLISIFLLIHEYRVRRVSTHELMTKAYDNMNALGLANEENLKALGAVLYPEMKDDLPTLRQRLFAYIALNAIELTFIAQAYKGIQQKTADPIVRDLLRSILHNKEALDIIEEGTYDPKFIALAQDVKKELNESETCHDKHENTIIPNSLGG